MSPVGVEKRPRQEAAAMTLQSLEVAATLDLPEDRDVVVAGDWHGNLDWIVRAIRAASRMGVQTLLHLGDFGLWPGWSSDLLRHVDRCVAESRGRTTAPGLERVLVTPGNHEDWAALDELFAAHPGKAVRVSESVWALPRGFRFTIGGRTFLSFGGAASIDFAHRVLHHSWWPSEMPTLDDVEKTTAGGAAEVLLTHDAGNRVTPLIEDILYGPSMWSPTELQYSAASRILINYVVEGTSPLLQFHGHYHVRDSAIFEREGLPPHRVEALSADHLDGNLVLLNLHDLSVTELEVPR